MTLVRCREGQSQCVRITGPAIYESLEDVRSTTDSWWLDLKEATTEEIDFAFKTLMPVHTLTLEDITRQRRDAQARPHLPKVEEFHDYLFVVVNPLRTSQWPELDDESPLTTQLAAVLTNSGLLTFHECSIPAVEGLFEYLTRHAEQGCRGPDFLFHLILDAMVDEYAPLLDGMVERLDALEDAIFQQNYDQKTLPQLLHLKRRLTSVRKILTYEREVLVRMSRGDFELISEHEAVYYRNVYDHLVRFTELTESSREMVGDLLQTHQAVVANRLNEVMKTLTMVSTVVLPMSIVTGVYGMNFEILPETKWQFGYLWALALMIAVGLAPLAWFRWKRWI